MDVNNQDIRENRSLREKEVIMDDVLSKMTEVDLIKMNQLQKYKFQYNKAMELLNKLRSGYEDLGIPLEDQFKNIDDFLINSKMSIIIDRMKEVDDLKVKVCPNCL